MLVKTKGIILQNIKYSESSIITKIYTREYGLLSFMVNGIRTAKSKDKMGAFQPMNILDLVIYLREHKNLLHIKEFRPFVVYQSLPFEFTKSALGLFILELLHKTIRNEREPNSEQFEFIEEALMHLEKSPKVSANFHLSFMLKYTKFIGFQMDLDLGSTYFDLKTGYSQMESPDHMHYISNSELINFHQLINLPFEDLSTVLLNKGQRNQYLQLITDYYIHHLENFTELKSPEVLSEMYA